MRVVSENFGDSIYDILECLENCFNLSNPPIFQADSLQVAFSGFEFSSHIGLDLEIDLNEDLVKKQQIDDLYKKYCFPFFMLMAILSECLISNEIFKTILGNQQCFGNLTDCIAARYIESKKTKAAAIASAANLELKQKELLFQWINKEISFVEI